jgi:hypothetical protein
MLAPMERSVAIVRGQVDPSKIAKRLRVPGSPYKLRHIKLRNQPADSHTNRATNRTEITSSSQSVRVILPLTSFSKA